jgi:ADP-ribosylglycohydrolase
VSDDTEHTVFVAQSLLAHPGSAERFARRLAWCLRLWLLSLPPGIGLATLRSILRLWIGISPGRSGVWSAGNGAAMRSAPIGLFFADRPEMLDAYVAASTRLTHSDPRALIGALAVARLTAWCVREDLDERPDAGRLVKLLREVDGDSDWATLVSALDDAIRCDLSVGEFAVTLGLSAGVTGYIYETLPVVVYAWYRHFGDFEGTLNAVLDCGGDTDTTGAIAGALAGAVVGKGKIPDDWMSGLRDFPRGRKLLIAIADRLDQARPRPAETLPTKGRLDPVGYLWPATLPRNLLLLLIVLAHGLRRLAPPY